MGGQSLLPPLLFVFLYCLKLFSFSETSSPSPFFEIDVFNDLTVLLLHVLAFMKFSLIKTNLQ